MLSLPLANHGNISHLRHSWLKASTTTTTVLDSKSGSVAPTRNKKDLFHKEKDVLTIGLPTLSAFGSQKSKAFAKMIKVFLRMFWVRHYPYITEDRNGCIDSQKFTIQNVIGFIAMSFSRLRKNGNIASSACIRPLLNPMVSPGQNTKQANINLVRVILLHTATLTYRQFCKISSLFLGNFSDPTPYFFELLLWLPHHIPASLTRRVLFNRKFQKLENSIPKSAVE